MERKEVLYMNEIITILKEMLNKMDDIASNLESMNERIEKLEMTQQNQDNKPCDYTRYAEDIVSKMNDMESILEDIVGSGMYTYSLGDLYSKIQDIYYKLD